MRLTLLYLRDDSKVKKLSIKKSNVLTLKDGFEMYIDNCFQRNLREATIKHYQQSFKQFYKYIPEDTLLNEINKETYDFFVVALKKKLSNDISINSYLRDLITVFNFLMKSSLIERFEMKSIKTSKANVETYTDNELKILLEKPNLKRCSFIEYQSWVIVNFLFSTGVRQHSLNNIKIRDIDIYNNLAYINVTKNRKPIVIPLSSTMVNILKEYLKYRQHKNEEDYLFCNVFGNQLTKSTGYHMLYTYNKKRGIDTTGLHRFRHTFAKQCILNGGSVVSLSKLLGHSSLAITENYIHLITSDFKDEVNEINLLNKFSQKEFIKMH